MKAVHLPCLLALAQLKDRGEEKKEEKKEEVKGLFWGRGGLDGVR